MINHDDLNAMRKLLKNKHSYHFYNIMGAIRGPDDKTNKDFKSVTIAIRAYIGFKDANCSGASHVYYDDDEELQKLIETVQNEFRRGTTDHYIQHLHYALNSIGVQNLLAFVKARS